ncbi:MAG: hypothetical protein KC413_21835, partial [Anaerolineales bacterium]|nr:hypothetical protein [Anaerolineales bacterium]
GKLSPGESTFTGVTTIHHEKGWWWKRGLNAVGAMVTGVVLMVLIITKFTEGAWVIVLAVPLLVLYFRGINSHYANVAEALSTKDLKLAQVTRPVADVMIVPVADIHRGTLYALQFARTFSEDVRAVCIVTSPAEHERLQRRWNRFPEITGAVKLVCIDYEYRDVLTPLVEYVEQVNNKEFPGQVVTIVIPEFVPESLGSHFLHNQTANFLRFRLRGQRDVAVIDVPYQI